MGLFSKFFRKKEKDISLIDRVEDVAETPEREEEVTEEIIPSEADDAGGEESEKTSSDESDEAPVYATSISDLGVAWVDGDLTDVNFKAGNSYMDDEIEDSIHKFIGGRKTEHGIVIEAKPKEDNTLRLDTSKGKVTVTQIHL